MAYQQQICVLYLIRKSEYATQIYGVVSKEHKSTFWQKETTSDS